MSRRRNKHIFWLCALALTALITPTRTARAQSPADVLDQYLVEHGMSRLRARMLEQEVARAAGDERVELAERLAELYSEELETAETPEDQREWERLARNLLAQVPELQSISMRLELAKARFSAVEKSAEQWRLRMAPESDRATIALLLDTLAKEFRELAGRAHADVRMLEGQEESVLAGDTDLIAESLARSRQQRSIAHYLAGWCILYLAEMAPNRDQAASLAGDAAEEFSWLLNITPSRVPAIDRVPDQLLKYEHMARAAIAVAACEELRGDTPKAIEWLDFVSSSPELPAGIASPLFARRAWVLARNHDWAKVRALLDARRNIQTDGQATTSPLSVVEARLLAVLAIESQQPGRDRDEVLRVAIADLIAQGEHAHLLDLTRRYSSADLNLTGFLAHHVRGIRLYDRARADQRAANEDDQLPTNSDAISKTYLDAASAFRAADESPDLANFAGSRAGNLMLLGMSLYFAGAPAADKGVDEAVTALLKAADLSQASSMASESLWMAIRVLEAHADRTPSDADRRRRADDLMVRFMERHPSSPRAGEIALRRALRNPRADERSLQMLLSVPEGTPQYNASRRHAEQMAYDLFRAAPDSESAWLASRYLTIAEPLLSIDQRLAFSGSDDAAQTVLLRCRRMLDALMSLSPPDHERAERVLDTLIAIRSGAQLQDKAVDAEIAFRRAQIALARGDEHEAVRIVESIRAASPELAESASRLVLRHVADQWSESQPGTEPRAQNAQRLLDLAAPIVAPDITAEALRDDPREATLRAITAQAAIEVWRADPARRDALDLATRLATTLFEAFPSDARVLTVSAEVAEARADHETALNHWRTLVSATKAGSDLWFQRRVRQLQSLARVDPDRAREALNQHRTLYPGLGPEPYRTALIELQHQLRVTTEDAP